MFKFIAGLFISVGALVQGAFGIHSSSTTSRIEPPPREFRQEERRMMASTTEDQGEMRNRDQFLRGVFGAVSAVNGTNITLSTRFEIKTEPKPTTGRASSSNATSSRPIPPVRVEIGNASTSITVDASEAKILKGNSSTTASISDITVGSKILVEGKISTSTGSIKAVVIRVGILPPSEELQRMIRNMLDKNGKPLSSSSTSSGIFPTPPPRGDDQKPVPPPTRPSISPQRGGR